VTPEAFSTIDNGWHLDDKGSRPYTAKLFAWLEKLPEFRRLFPESAPGSIVGQSVAPTLTLPSPR
jgi:hypothetical protein